MQNRNEIIDASEQSPLFAYGHVWSQPAKTLDDIKGAQHSEIEAFRLALSKGYFSQYTSYQQRDLVERLVDWQLTILNKQFGEINQFLPECLNELSIVPEILQVNRESRAISPDLLRNLWYMLYINAQKSIISAGKLTNVIEIGSGYGCFARIVKAFNPGARVWLVDLPESLHYAKTYLSHAYPDAKIETATADSSMDSLTACDFVLVPVEQSNVLKGWQFDLAVNIWSFGEMPNTWIQHWFDMLQYKCEVKHLYLLNAFSSPVTITTTDRTQQGDWLSQLNDKWIVEDFQVDPEIHQCPWVKNFYTGLSLFCSKLDSEEQLLSVKQIAKSQVKEVFLEDWVSIATAGSVITNLERPETNITSTPGITRHIGNVDVGSAKLLSITEYIGHPRFDTAYLGTFYRLWNDFRLNSTLLSGSLLVSYLGMVFKSELNHRCTKEEIFLLKRMPRTNLHFEYSGFLGDLSNNLIVEYNGGRYEIQQACDLAEMCFQRGDFNTAKGLSSQVIMVMPHHGHSWYQLSRILQGESNVALAMVMASAAVKLAPDSSSYKDNYECILQSFRNDKKILWPAYSISMKIPDSVRRLVANWVSKIPFINKSSLLTTFILGGVLKDKQSVKYFADYQRINPTKLVGKFIEAFKSK